MNDEKKKNTLYQVVNENDEVIGLEEKDKILKEGLLRRIIHIWFFTPKGEIIFQHREKDKDIFPDLLDATVGGKVEPGESYEDAAIHEAEEETGVVLKKEDLIPVEKFRIDFLDDKTNFRNNIFSTYYVYCYKGNIKDLKIEVGKIIGFEAFSIEKLMNLTEEEKKRFIQPVLSSPEFMKVINKIKSLLKQ